jgi:hypothetical protein
VIDENNINDRVVCGALYQPRAAFADDGAPAALTGQVTSDAEGVMEGVVVTAHKDGSIVSVSVTTDARLVHLPREQAGTGRVQDHDPRSGLRHQCADHG